MKHQCKRWCVLAMVSYVVFVIAFIVSMSHLYFEIKHIKNHTTDINDTLEEWELVE